MPQIFVRNLGVRRFFTFIVPLACVNYFPILFVLGKHDPLESPAWLQTLSPAGAALFLLAGVAIWRASGDIPQQEAERIDHNEFDTHFA